MRRATLAIVATALAAAPAASQTLSGDDLRSLVAGKRVYLSTPYGGELPLRYAANGSVAGDISGFSFAGLFAPRETGRWWVDGPRLCQQWKSWYDGKTLCFTISQTAPGRIRWVRQDGYSGTARIED